MTSGPLRDSNHAKRRRPPLVSVFLRLLVIGLVVYGCGKSAPPPRPDDKIPPPPAKGQPKPYKVLGQWYQPISDARGFRERGLASWYGEPFHGRKTSNGETYNMYGISAAHKTLPLGTYVRVHNLENNRRMDLRINDRGPFVHGRVIDLSYGAAQKLGVVGPGTVKVDIVALGTPVSGSSTGGRPTYVPGDYYTGNFTYQVGAFKNYANAERLRQELAGRYPNAHITSFDSGEGIFYRVRVGRFSNLDKAEAFLPVLTSDGFQEPFMVAE